MYQSESIAGLAASLSLFQASCGEAKKNATNPHLKNKYADLGSVWEAVRGPLGEYNLAVVQLPMPSEPGTLKLRTQLVHSSGEWLASEIVMPLAKADPQGYGSALTYARRYALAAMLGVTQDDDDAASAVKRSDAPAAAPTPIGAKRLTDAQVKKAQATRGECGLTPEAVKRLCADNGLPASLTTLWTPEQFDSLLNLMTATAAEMEHAQ